VSEQPVWVTVSAHVQAATPVTVRLHPEDARVVVIVGDNGGWPRVDLYLSRPVLAQFRDTLTAALTDLDDAIRTPADVPNASGAGSTDDPDRSETVRNSAA
jgi:hypothetical protein